VTSTGSPADHWAGIDWCHNRSDCLVWASAAYRNPQGGSWCYCRSHFHTQASAMVGLTHGGTCIFGGLLESPTAPDVDMNTIAVFIAVWNPNSTRTGRAIPMTSCPDPMPAPDPVAANPNISGARRDRHGFHNGSWRGFRHSSFLPDSSLRWCLPINCPFPDNAAGYEERSNGDQQ